MKFYIAVPNLNYGKYLDACLRSIEQQTEVVVSVIVVDGGSTDDSQHIAKKYCERNGWKFYEKRGVGQAASINFAFEEFSSVAEEKDLFGWLNSDDIYLRKNALSIVKEYFSDFSNVGCVSLGGFFIDEQDKMLSPVVYNYHPLIKGDVFKRGGGFLQPATFWRKEVWSDIGIREDLKFTFDGDFFLRAKKAGINFMIDTRVPISGYRIHGNNLSLNIPERRVHELALLYKEVLDRKYAARYLSALSVVLRLFGRTPKVGMQIKRVIRTINNGMSYVSVYRIPSI